MSAYSFRDQTAIIIWLSLCTFLVMGMVALGGYTRLTGSGLSITEWAPIHGAIPPLSAEEWQEEFDAYKQIPQYEQINKGMSLEEFKTIYWPEFLHRLLGRAIGMVFFFPLIVFCLRRSLSRPFALRLVAIFALGGLQGAVGWIMVASGLKPDMLYVSPIKLALHLGIAFTIFALLIWAILDVKRNQPSSSNHQAQRYFSFWCVLLAVQIIVGALVAGLHAGLIYNTWPLMGDHFIAPDIWDSLPVLVQAIHRILAILVLVTFMVGWYVYRAHLGKKPLLVSLTLLTQFGLGVWTLLDGDQGVAPLALALSHQMVGLILVGNVAVYMHQLRSERT